MKIRLMKRKLDLCDEMTQVSTTTKLQDGYVWNQKTLAKALTSQGRVEKTRIILFETHVDDPQTFGKGMLTSEDATCLLQTFYEGHSSNFSLSSKATQDGVVDGQRLVKLRWGSKAEVVGAKGLRMGITLSSQGALEKATLLIDACNGLTKAVVGPVRFYGRVLVEREEVIIIQEENGFRSRNLEVPCFPGMPVVGRLELPNVGRRNIEK